MSPYPSSSVSIPVASPTPSSAKSTITTDSRLRTVIIVLSILAGILMVYVIYLTLSVKRRRRTDGEKSGPYQGTVMYPDHPAAQISPFGNSTQNGPRFQHKPGEDMRIAIRRPDGAWHFTDSRTPFAPLGVNDLDVAPAPRSPSASIFSFNSSKSKLPSRKAQEVKMELRRRYDPELDFEVMPTTPPPPAYHPDDRREEHRTHSAA